MTTTREYTAWDLCGDEGLIGSGFTIGNGRVVWEAAQPSRTWDTVRVARLVAQDDGTIRQFNAYVKPDATAHLTDGEATR